jgi:hypothetical protein
MLQIQKTLVSSDIIEKKFCCDLDSCKGVCCVKGDSGAPLEPEEAEIIENIFEDIKEFMSEAGIKTIERDGFYVIDKDNDLVTPLIDGKECAYTYFENNVALCAIEKAYLNYISDFRKPVSCHLYPVRVKKYKNFEAVNYESWQECGTAILCGRKKNIPLYIFLKEALIRKFGDNWYEQLEYAAKNIDQQ